MKFSLLLRRTHMYLALFFVPWVAVYSLSTLLFNHGIQKFTAGPANEFRKESEQVYGRVFPEEATPQAMARQILEDLHLSGTHFVSRRPEGKLVIHRQDPLTPRRLTYTPESGVLVVERQDLNLPTWLRVLHHRSGYRHDQVLEDGWAFSVDLVILAMIFWVFSGMWMCWELRATRRWGLLCALAGTALFLFLVLSL